MHRAYSTAAGTYDRYMVSEVTFTGVCNIARNSCKCARVLVVMSDERDVRRSVNKPMTGSEMEQQLLKQLQHECNVTQQRRPMTSRDERASSNSSETMTTQPLGVFTYV